MKIAASLPEIGLGSNPASLIDLSVISVPGRMFVRKKFGLQLGHRFDSRKRLEIRNVPKFCFVVGICDNGQ